MKNQISVNFIVSLALTALLAIACATKSGPEAWKMSQGLPSGEALIVMDIDLRAQGHMGQSHQCHLHARYHDGRDVKFAIMPGMRRYFWSAPVGLYEMKFMSCGMFSRFDLEDYPSFTLKANDAYYFGLKTLIIESRDSMQWSFEDMTKERLLTQFLSLPDLVRHRILSVFSGRQLTEELIRKTPPGPQVLVKKGQLTDHTWPFQACVTEENRRNPLRAGLYHLKVSWTDRGGPFLEVLDSAHLYTDQFDQCLRHTLESWKVEARTALSLEVLL
jgi:hypothetical protein